MRVISAALNSSLKNLQSYGNLRFTSRQLYYEVCRALKSPKGLDAPAAAALFATGLLPTLGLARRKTELAAGLFAVNSLLTGGLIWLRRAPHTLAAPLSFNNFEDVLTNYLQRHQRPIGLLASPGDETDFSNVYPSDLSFYGLPRLLICQQLEIAQMLLANNFHLESSCAIVHLEKAAPLGAIFQKMLARAGQSRVYFLHDASVTAYSQLADLPERLMLPESARLTALGLRPVHAERLHLFVQQKEPVSQEEFETLQFLSESEKCWLATGKQAEVSAVNPIRLLRVLRRLVSGSSVIAPYKWKITLPARKLGFMSELV